MPGVLRKAVKPTSAVPPTIATGAQPLNSTPTLAKEKNAFDNMDNCIRFLTL
jgi:hypothetical protein